MLPSEFRRPLIAVGLGLCALGVAAQPSSAASAPSYPQLLVQAQSAAPRLAEAQAGVARAEGLARQAALVPNPSLTVDLENFSGSGPFQGTIQAEATYSLQQTLELGGKRGARVAVGRSEVAAAQARANRTRVDFAFDLAMAYAEAEAAQRRFKLASDVLSLTEEDARISTALVEAGREADLRRIQAQAAVEAARASLAEARSAQETALANLTSLSGSQTPIDSIEVSLLDSGGAAATSTEAVATLGVIAADAEKAAAERQLMLERRKAIPDVDVSVGVRQFNGDDATALVAGLSVPLPLFNRNQGAVAAARADVSAAEARANAALLEAQGAIRSSTARVAASEARLTAANQGEGAAQEAYRLARIGYEAGKLPLVELVNARRALAEARAQSIAAAVERAGARAAQVRLGGYAAPGANNDFK